MWALLHVAYPVAEEHVDRAVAVHRIFAVMPFPVLSCFPSPGCPLWAAATEGQSFHQKSQGQMGHSPGEMWTSAGDPCSRGRKRGNVKRWCRVQKCFFQHHLIYRVTLTSKAGRNWSLEEDVEADPFSALHKYRKWKAKNWKFGLNYYT